MIAYINIIANVALLSGLVSGAPYLGGPLYHQTLVDPYVYLPPNHSPLLYQSHPYQQIFGLPLHQQQLISAPTISSVPEQHLYEVTSQIGQTIATEEVPEINQFHSEDAQGRVLYGFHGHNQARMEARDAQGRVRGSYSYIDPNGQLVRMDYWDDGSGFQARGNNVPKAIYDVPSFTPEVQAAREEHFKLYQQILLSSVQAQQQSQAQKPQAYPPQSHPPHVQPPNKLTEIDDYPYIERPDGASTSPTGFEDDDDTVEVGVYPNQPSDMPAYDRPTNFPSYPNRPSNIQSYPIRPVNHQPSYPNGANDVPPFSSTSDDQSYPGSMRLPGTFQQPSFPFQSVEDDDPESIALDNPEFQDLGRGAKSLDVKDNRQEGTNQNNEKMGKDFKNMHSKSDMKKSDNDDRDKMSGTNERMMTENVDNSNVEEMASSSEDNQGHNGFSYHIQYKVGSSAKIQSLPNFNKVSSIAASEPVSLNSKTTLHRVHPLPLHTMTGHKNEMIPNRMAIPSAVHDSQVRPSNEGLQRPMIIKTYQPSVGAVHNQQAMRRSMSNGDLKTEPRTN